MGVEQASTKNNLPTIKHENNTGSPQLTTRAQNLLSEKFVK